MQSGEPRGVWIYAVAADARESVPGDVTGVGGEVPRCVVAAGLRAIAGDVALSEFGETALRRNLEDLAWLDRTARAHHRVIEAAARQVAVVPMRLATVYRDDAGVGAMLAERSADFRAALERTSAREEWGVKAYAARPAAPQSAGPAGRPGYSGQPESGAAYLQRRRQELTAQRDTRQAATASAEEVHAALSRMAAGTRLHPPQSQELTGNTAPMIFNAAYLLDIERGPEFADAVSDLAERYPAVRLELTGPWPPYSFAALEPAGPRAS